MLPINTLTNSYSGSRKGRPVLYPAGLGLLLQGLDAAAVGAQVRHQGLVLLQQSLWTERQSQQTGAALEEGQRAMQQCSLTPTVFLNWWVEALFRLGRPVEKPLTVPDLDELTSAESSSLP